MATTYMGYYAAVWLSIEEPKYEPSLVHAGRDSHHDYHYAPYTGKMYRCLSDVADPYWHVMDCERTHNGDYDSLQSMPNAHFSTDTGWVIYPEEAHSGK